MEHLLYAGGPSETYRITVEPFEPSFDLALGIEQFDVAAGSSTPIVLYATRNGYTGPIEVSVVGHPGIIGKTEIKATPPPPPNQPAGKLTVNVKPDVPMGPYFLLIQGKAMIDGKPVIVNADVTPTIKESMAGLAFPPRDLIHRVGLAVTETWREVAATA